MGLTKTGGRLDVAWGWRSANPWSSLRTVSLPVILCRNVSQCIDIAAFRHWGFLIHSICSQLAPLLSVYLHCSQGPITSSSQTWQAPGLSPPHLLSHPGLLQPPLSFLAAPSEVPSPTSKHWVSSFFRCLSWTHFSLNISIHPRALSTIQKDNCEVVIASDLIAELQTQIYNHLLDFHLELTWISK